MVQMDFSENFSCVYQDVVSSAHSKRNSVTLYTVMIWFRDQSISMVLLSGNNNHDKTTVVPYTAYVLNYIKEHFGDNVHDIEIWTDGPSNHFENKYIFGFIGITLPQLITYKVFWNYSATSHGKGAVDGVGGIIKWVVTRKAIVKDTVSMFNAFSKKTKSHLAVMTQEYIASTLWEILVCISYGKTLTHYLAQCTFTVLSKQAREKFLPTCSAMIDPAISIPWTQLSWQSLTNTRAQMSGLWILSLWNMEVHFTWEKFFIWYQTSQQQ